MSWKGTGRQDELMGSGEGGGGGPTGVGVWGRLRKVIKINAAPLLFVGGS